MSRVLRAESLSFAYPGGPDVFTNVTATVRGGELLGVVGPNGAGKSTLLRALCGLLRPRAGTVTLDGKALSSIAMKERAQTIAFLPQQVQPAFSLTAFEVVCLGRFPYLGAFGGWSAHDCEIAERCLVETETDSLRDRDFVTLSGGERQRVLVASVLAQEPDLLLLDEPTSALDIHHQIEIFALLRRLARGGYGVGVVTHDLNLAARFCDSLALMAKEQGVVADGKPTEVLTEGLLSKAYCAKILVGTHPITGAPLVTAAGDDE